MNLVAAASYADNVYAPNVAEDSIYCGEAPGADVYSDGSKMRNGSDDSGEDSSCWSGVVVLYAGVAWL